jgi:hypothetical protein
LNIDPGTLNAPKDLERLERLERLNYHKSSNRPPVAKTAKPETLIDNSILAEIGKSGLVDRLYN